jgi:putative colanic acid biosynthesis acetyltransferase WcaF
MRSATTPPEPTRSDRTAKPVFSQHVSSFSFWQKVARATWGMIWLLLFRPSPRICFGWRRFLLRCFRAQIAAGVRVYPSARIWAPWNLEMDERSNLGPFVDCYCVDRIRIGAYATVSQYSYLCTASHDITDPKMKLITAPITIGAGAWVCADVFVSPGIAVGEGAVAGARAVVTKDVEPWAVVAGNPAKFVKKRQFRDAAE